MAPEAYPWICKECDTTGELTLDKSPTTVEEMTDAIKNLKESHAKLSPDCKANTVSEETVKKVEGGEVRYIVLQARTAPPTAAELMVGMTFTEQLAILRIGIKTVQDNATRRSLTDFSLLIEQMEIRLARVEQFIISIAHPQGQIVMPKF